MEAKRLVSTMDNLSRQKTVVRDAQKFLSQSVLETANKEIGLEGL